jgi:2-polyprenyl-3-methyl-5-hydroxy-6-metoxy-1,4-benzoquinol methylase
MIIHGKEKTNQEVIKFVKNYVDDVSHNKKTRFYKTMASIPDFVGKKVETLDYGCGWGGQSVALQNKGHKVTAIDLSKNEIDICNLVWGNKDINFQHQAITELEGNKFDFVISSQVIEHTHNPGMYLSEINRVLKPNGNLIINLPNIITPRFIATIMNPRLKTNLKNISKEILLDYKKETHHIQAWDPIHFTMLCASVGFELEEYTPMEGMPLPLQFPIKNIDTKIKFLKNMSYTMLFKLKKVKTISIGVYSSNSKPTDAHSIVK